MIESDLTGRLLALDEGDEPVLLRRPGSALVYLPCFASPAELGATLAHLGLALCKIKQIDSGREFLRAIPKDVVVLVDPERTAEGRMRFVQVKRG